MIATTITDFKPIHEKSYDDFVLNFDVTQFTCNCGRSGCCVRHAYYTRTVKNREGTELLHILRVRCKSCGKTHAILPETVVPYSQISVDIQYDITQSSSSVVERKVMEDNLDIDESNIAYIKRKYQKYWHALVLSLSSSFSTLRQLCSACVSELRKQFMQIKRGIYLFFTPIHTTCLSFLSATP